MPYRSILEELAIALPARTGIKQNTDSSNKNSGMLSPACILHLMLYCLKTGYDDLQRKKQLDNNMHYALMLLFNLYEGMCGHAWFMTGGVCTVTTLFPSGLSEHLGWPPSWVPLA